MRVRFISGNQAGQIVDVGPEGAILISNHVAELVPEDLTAVAPDAVDAATPAPDPAPTPDAAPSSPTPEPPSVPAARRSRKKTTPKQTSPKRRG